MSLLDRAIAAHRAAALRHEREAQRAILEAYRAIETRLRADLDALTARIAAAEAAGEEVGPAWLDRDARYRALIAQTEAEIARYGQWAASTIAQGQRGAALAALGTGEGLLRAALGTPPPGVAVTFHRLPLDRPDRLVGALSDGSPLAALLDGLGVEAAAAGRKALLEGLGRGLGPRQLAREFRRGTNVSAVRALRISRQEVNRAFRDAGLATLRENADVATGWRWVCAGSRRTCAACYAKHGTVHRLDEPFASHVCCRCACVPVTKSWAELGFAGVPDTRPAIPDRDELFGRLSADDQRFVLGPGAYDLWRAGEVALTDMATPTHSARWGDGVRVTPLYALERRRAAAAD